MTGHGRPTHPFFVRTRTGPNYPDVLPCLSQKHPPCVCPIHIYILSTPYENMKTKDLFAAFEVTRSVSNFSSEIKT